MKNFYVYIIRCNNKLVYIGKGTKDRYKVSAKSQYFVQQCPSHLITVVKILTNLEEEKAFNIEKLLIKQNKPIFNRSLNDDFNMAKAISFIKRVNKNETLRKTF